METLSIVISIVGAYWLLYKSHCAEVDRIMTKRESEAQEENFHRIERHIKQLHSNGKVFGGVK